MKIIQNTINIIIYPILIFITVSNDVVAQDKYENKKDTISIVVSADIFGGVNHTDAQAAMALTMNEMLAGLSDQIGLIEPVIANSVSEIKDRIEQNRADIIGLFSLDFIKYRSEMSLEPIFVVQRESAPGSKYILLTKNNNRINSLSDLRAKKVLTYDTREDEIIKKWLFVEMKKEKIKNPFEIVNSFTKILKPTKMVFSVFFGNADACIVMKTQFESMCELNPQLKKELKIIAESPSFLTHIFSKNKKSQKYSMGNSREYALASAKTKNGKQLLKLFKANKIIKCQDSLIEPLENLSKEYNKYN